MPFLVRKLNIAKWRQADIAKSNDVSADAISCLRTRGNALSVWEIPDETATDLAALALLADPKRTSFDTMDVVLIRQDCIEESGIEINECDGETAANSLTNTHRDLKNLTYSSLGTIKDCIVETINAGKSKRYTEADLKKLLLDAIDKNYVKLEDLHVELQGKVKKHRESLHKP